MDKIFYGFLIAFFVISLTLLGALGYATFRYYTADKIELVKSEWKCSETRIVDGILMAGKVPVPTKTKACVVYRKI